MFRSYVLFQHLSIGHLSKTQITLNDVRSLSVSLNVLVNMIIHYMVTNLHLRV